MHFKSIIAALGLSMVSLLPADAHAGTGQGRISATSVEGTQYARIYVYGSHTSKPACATSGSFALDISTAKGKAIFSSIVAAALAGRVVEVVGDGACGTLTNSETVSKLTFWTDDF